jgi:predicted ribosomally synthesized peptide with SipW-like signal peptide
VSKKFGKLHIKKIALALSLCLLVVWGLLGAGTSLAWFSDSSQDINNIFHFGSLDVSVGFRQPDGSYAPIDERTDVFDPNALFEPGYMQIVYLEVKNTGTCDFTFTTGVNVTGYTPATNVFGLPLNLQQYLLFGMIWAPTEDALRQQLSGREQVRALATLPLNNYAEEIALLHPGETCYVALMVYMPETVGNAANYRGSAPSVELGLIVKATQQET